jgi:hypothetical protein
MKSLTAQDSHFAASGRGSWHDCHIGYYFIGMGCYLAAWCFGSAGLVIVATSASLSRGYAVAFYARSDGSYSSLIWWLALMTSILILFIAVMLELNLDKGIGVGAILAICIAGKLALGQLMFLFRRRSERLSGV